MAKITRWVCPGPSQELIEQSVDIAQLKPHEVLVAVKYCSLARGDVHMIDNDWDGSPYPSTPGHELIGIVADVGQAVEVLKPGDIVGVGYQLSACMNCEFCTQGFEQFCNKQTVAFYDRPGGWASHIIADEPFVQKVGANLDQPDYAALFSSGLTVFSGIRRARLAPQSKVAVFGIGGLGHLASIILGKMGHTVTLLSHTEDKRAFTDRLGASQFINTADDKSMESLKTSYDFIISTVNVEFDMEMLLHLLRPQGVLCVVGLPQAKVSLHATSLADYAQRTIYGSYIGSVQDMKDLLQFTVDHQVKPLVQNFPMDTVNSHIDDVRQGKPRFRYVLTRS
jgi:D-arabinose 1-dehydrogenase-like Zn-dependent alcohol dehydrogenase